MSSIEAVYRHGVFEPLEPVNLHEEQRVQLRIELADDQTPQAWLDQVRALQDAVLRRRGFLPNSALEIAADRNR